MFISLFSQYAAICVSVKVFIFYPHGCQKRIQNPTKHLRWIFFFHKRLHLRSLADFCICFWKCMYQSFTYIIFFMIPWFISPWYRNYIKSDVLSNYQINYINQNGFLQFQFSVFVKRPVKRNFKNHILFILVSEFKLTWNWALENED